MSDPVPAVTEAAATGETAEIFADIRRILGVEVVNLIWRHLAMIPGALPTAWGILRPPYADGTITAAASALRGELDLPRLPVLPAAALSAAGLLADDVRMIRNILAAYNKTNAMALVALSALSLRLDGATPTHEGASSHDVAPPPVALGSISLPPRRHCHEQENGNEQAHHPGSLTWPASPPTRQPHSRPEPAAAIR